MATAETRVREALSNLGAKLGNWNDAHSTHDSRSEATRRYRVLDRIASWLCVLPDRGPIFASEVNQDG